MSEKEINTGFHLSIGAIEEGFLNLHGEVEKIKNDINKTKVKLETFQPELLLKIGEKIKEANEKFSSLKNEVDKLSKLNKENDDLKSGLRNANNAIADLRILNNNLKISYQEANAELEKKLAAQNSDIKQNESSMSKKIEDLSKKIENKADRGSSRLDERQGFNTCVMLCLILLFNMFATWSAYVKPEWFENSRALWVAIFILTNVAALVIWGYHLIDSYVDFGIWELVMEVITLILNIVVIFRCILYPITDTTFFTFILLVSVIIANIMAFIIRIVYFSDEYFGNYDVDIEECTPWIAGLLTFFDILILILIIVI